MTTKKKTKKKQYFTKETQEKIALYQKEARKYRKDLLYREHIMPAFEELVQNLVAVYGFKSYNEDINHLKSDCVTFLFETIHKWNPDNGTKAFSYFNVVAKNWLTINSRRHHKSSKRSVSFEEPESFSRYDKKQLVQAPPCQEYEEEERKRNLPLIVLEMIDEIEVKLKEERDIRCIHAVREVFKKADDLDYLNKRAVFVYLREISGLNSTELSSSLSNIRKIYKKLSAPGKKFEIF